MGWNARRNFAPVDYVDEKGESRRSIDMTRDGFMFIVMGFTGKRAAQFKERFIAAFNEMERALIEKAQVERAPAGAQGSLAVAMETNRSLATIEKHLHGVDVGMAGRFQRVASEIIGAIVKHVAHPILDKLDANQRWNEMRFEAIHRRDKMLLESLASKHDAEECVSIAVAQTMMGVPAAHRSARLSRNLSANAVHWFLAHGFTARPDAAHAKAPMVFQKSKIAEWWKASGRAIYQRDPAARGGKLVSIDGGRA